MCMVLVVVLNYVVVCCKVLLDVVFEWNLVRFFKDVSQCCGLYLECGQCCVLLDVVVGLVCDLIECVVFIGCRLGDLVICLCLDYDGCIVSVRFCSKDYDCKILFFFVVGVMFDWLVKGKFFKVYLFIQDGGKVWIVDVWSDFVREVVVCVGLFVGVMFYILWYCWIMDVIVGGMDLLIVVKLVGMLLVMIEKYYGYLVQGVVCDKLVQVQFF